MLRYQNFKIKWAIVLCFALACLHKQAHAQLQAVFVNFSAIEGQEVNPQNVFNFQVFNNSGQVRDAEVIGTLHYRNLPLRFTYTFKTILRNGINSFSKDAVGTPVWNFSDNAFRELFFTYGKLPQGTYEYCIELRIKDINAEQEYGDPVGSCIYQTVSDIFLINLVTPENDAKLYEQYPMLSWMVNYPFASELTYRLRIVELKQGQNNENAIARNNPIFTDKHVMATGMAYPVAARPLQKFQPYVWTVDAYYKGILLGGAEPWRFTIIEDSALKEVVVDQSYYDFESHIGDTRLDVVGEMRLKYRADGFGDTLFLKITDHKGNEVKYKDSKVPLSNGDNWLVIKFHEKANLKHEKHYNLNITTTARRTFIIPFAYTNPLFKDERK